MNNKLYNYINSVLYTPIQNLLINNRSKDWYVELGKYIDNTIDISSIPDFSYIVSQRPKKVKNFLSFNDDDRIYSMMSMMFLTATLDEVILRKMFGEPLLHNEFGEGFEGEWDEENDEELEPNIKESHASYFVKVVNTDFHIGYDHRGTNIEIKLDKRFQVASDIEAEKCFESLKNLIDLYKKKI